jgi:hypothetical protein
MDGVHNSHDPMVYQSYMRDHFRHQKAIRCKQTCLFLTLSAPILVIALATAIFMIALNDHAFTF